VFNISAMSFGALSANAILALNAGAKRGGFAHDTGEGSISRYHRAARRRPDLGNRLGLLRLPQRRRQLQRATLRRQCRDPQVKMIELKLSQGAKPGHGGVLPGPKVTPEIAAGARRAGGRGLRLAGGAQRVLHADRDAAVHRAPARAVGGKPVGFKLCIGHPWEWFAIVKAMLETGITPDFIVVDGAEGGTGAAPLEFTDHVGAPLQEGLLLVHNTLVGREPARPQIKHRRAGKVVTPSTSRA
jgi:glutamate synthase domain-containing protein 2